MTYRRRPQEIKHLLKSHINQEGQNQNLDSRLMTGSTTYYLPVFCFPLRNGQMSSSAFNGGITPPEAFYRQGTGSGIWLHVGITWAALRTVVVWVPHLERLDLMREGGGGQPGCWLFKAFRVLLMCGQFWESLFEGTCCPSLGFSSGGVVCSSGIALALSLQPFSLYCPHCGHFTGQ